MFHPEGYFRMCWSVNFTLILKGQFMVIKQSNNGFVLCLLDNDDDDGRSGFFKEDGVVGMTST